MGNEPGKITKLSSTTHCQFLFGNVVGKAESAGEEVGGRNGNPSRRNTSPGAEHVPPGRWFGNVLLRCKSRG